MSKVFGNLVSLGGAGGQSGDLPPLLDNFKASVPVEGIPVKNMPVGTKIKVPVNTDYQSFLGKNITWMVIDHAHTGYPQNYTTLRTEKIIACLSFDAGEPENTDSNRRSNGNNNYFVSNIDSWLNSDNPAGKWWSKSHTYDSAPTIENVSYNPYKDKSGFLAMLNSKFVNIILGTPIKYKQPDVDSGGLVTSNRKVFLLSETELGGTSNGEGYKFSIYTDDESRKHYPTQEAYDNSAYKDSSFATNKPWYVWTRTQESSNSSYVRRIFIQGNIDSNTAKTGTHGIVPVCNISSDTLLNAEPDSDGCYTLAELAPVTIAESDNYSITLSADKMEERRAEQLAGAVWVYGDHVPKNVNDGTKIQLTREEITRPDRESYITLNDVPASDAEIETIINIKESDGELHPYLYLSNDYLGSGAGLLLRKDCYQKGVWHVTGVIEVFNGSQFDVWCSNTFPTLLDTSISNILMEVDLPTKTTGAIRRKCFTLSNTEYGGSMYPAEGTALPYFKDNVRRQSMFNGGIVDYWTRSKYDVSQVYFIGLTGGFRQDRQTLSLGYRPAFCLPLTFKLKATPNENGSYDMYDEVSSISTFASSEFIVEKSVSWEQTKDFYARQFTYNSKKQYQTMLEGATANIIYSEFPEPPTSYGEIETVSKSKTWPAPEDGYFKFIGVAKSGDGASGDWFGINRCGGGSGGSGGIVVTVLQLYKGQEVNLTVSGSVSIKFNDMNASATAGTRGNAPLKGAGGTGGRPGSASGGSEQNISGKFGNNGGSVQQGTANGGLSVTTSYEGKRTTSGRGGSWGDLGELSPATNGTAAYIVILRGNTNTPSPSQASELSLIPKNNSVEAIWENSGDPVQTGTMLVYNTRHVPKSPSDGVAVDIPLTQPVTLALNSNNELQEDSKKQSYTITGVPNDKPVFVALFPYDKDRKYGLAKQEVEIPREHSWYDKQQELEVEVESVKVQMTEYQEYYNTTKEVIE